MAQLWYSPLNINAAQVPTTQSNFPVLVSVTDARLKDVAHGGHVNRSDGFDIRPYTDTTLVTALSYELERYIPSTGELIMWVKVASLTSSSTPIVLGYGDTGITTDGSSGTNTFSNSFDAVYHLKDGTTLSLVDALGSHNGSNHSATATSGKIDGAASLASVSSQYIDCGAFADSSACTLSAWVNATSFPNTYNGIGGWNATATTRQAMIWVKSTGKMTFFVQAASGSVGYDGTGSNTLSSATDYYIVMTYSSAAGLVGYVNASSDGTAAANGVLASHTAVASYIGQDPVTAGRFWNGKIDEFRVATVARSADWITTEYNNQSAPGTFETLGAEVGTSPFVGIYRI